MSRDDYIEVHERVREFFERCPSGSLQSQWEWVDRDGERWLLVKAYAYRDPQDDRPGIGHAWEPVPGRTPYTRGSELMVGETSAWGRALAALGIAVHRGIATGSEIRAAEGRQIERTKPSAADADEWATRPPAAEAPRRASGKQLNYIKRLCDQAGATDRAEALGLVNACLLAAQLPTIENVAVMTDAQARAVIDGIKASQTVEQAAADLAAGIARRVKP